MLEAHGGLDAGRGNTGRGNLGRGQDLLGQCPEVRANLAVVRRQFKQAPSFRSYSSHQPVRHRSRLSIKKVPGFLSIQVTVLIRPQPQRTGLTRISLQRILCQHSIKKRNPFDSAEQEAAPNLARTYDRLQSSFTQFFKQHGISGAQYNVLRILRGVGEPLPCQEIAGRMITRLPDITRLVDRLLEAGLVERSRTPMDRRLVLTTITEAGLRLLAAIDDPLLRLHREQLGHLTRSELAELNRLLVKARNSA